MDYEKTMSKAIIIIPARMESKRLPGKPLLLLRKRALLHHVYNRAGKTGADRIIVATADKQIINYCEDWNLQYKITSDKHENGTQRCAEVLDKMDGRIPDVGAIVNWQSDEPMVFPFDVDLLITETLKTKKITTLVAPLSEEEKQNENIVKVEIAGEICHWISQ